MEEPKFSPKEVQKNQASEEKSAPKKRKVSKKDAMYITRYIDGVKHMILRSDADLK